MDITKQLKKNRLVFKSLLEDVNPDFITWRPNPDKWCLLEIVCHLYDEERYDFRFRTQWVLEKPNETPPPFNPINWVTEHKYIAQDYADMLDKFIAERQHSIDWLKSLENPKWANTYEHIKLGKVSAKHYFDNWLAHDYLHLRQILKLKFDYLDTQTNENLEYAGIW